MELTLMILGLGLAIYIAWCIGTNDAANPTQYAVGSGAIHLRRALILFTIFTALGALLQGWMVMKTFGRGVAEIRDIHDALAATIATGIWVTIASFYGIPISTTHSSVGSVLGVGLSYLLLEGSMSINLSVIYKIIISWIASPLGAMLLAIILYKLFAKLYVNLRRKGLDADKIFKYIVIGGLAYSAYSFGANDVGNATGVYIAVIKVGGVEIGEVNLLTALLLAALGSLGIVIGGFTVGPRVIATVAFKITRLDLVSGAAVGLANASIVWLFTTIPHMLYGFGMPISTTHASVSAVIGIGLLRGGLKGINISVVLKILTSWLITVPLAAALALSLRVLTHSIFNV